MKFMTWILMINPQNEKQIAPALRMYNEPEYHMTPDDEVDYNYAEIMLDNYGLKIIMIMIYSWILFLIIIKEEIVIWKKTNTEATFEINENRGYKGQ